MMMTMKSRSSLDRGSSVLHIVLSFLLGGLLFAVWSNLLLLSTPDDTYEVLGRVRGDGEDGKRNLLENQLHLVQQSLKLDGVGQGRRRDQTLVLYIYNAADEEQQRNFAFFLRYGITDGPTYRIIITKGGNVLNFPRLPTLPDNAQYLRTELCTDTWGAIDAVRGALPFAQHEYIMVIDATVRGPFMPPYMVDTLHWTEAFTSKINARTKLVGSIISCEGAPKGGNAASNWRANPHVLPHAFATDMEGWRVLAAQPGVVRCHVNHWDARYHSDVGSALAIINAGYNLDCLMTRYQGIDWTDTATWNCNQRVRPDYDMHYDGVSISPYETIFVAVNSGSVDNRWSFVKAAEKYEEWMDRQLRPVETRPGVDSNAWISDHWTAKSERLVSTNARGPGCFDFPYYVQHNPDVKSISKDPLAVWEHFMLLGQFQGRRHKFTCPMTVGNSYRVAYVLARGSRCFDHEFYSEAHKDLEGAGLVTSSQLFEHFAEFGQFERRKARFVCADTVMGLPAGFDTDTSGTSSTSSLQQKRAQATAIIEQEEQKELEERAAILAQAGNATDPVVQALKGALVAETAKDMFKKAKKP